MSIATKVSAYLDETHINYQIIEHQPSQNSLSSAAKSHIKTSQLVKAVILEDLQGSKLMAILPSSHKVSLRALNEHFKRHFHIVKESHLYELFDDCKHGAIPPLAQAYDMDKVYDLFLTKQPLLYLEAGDHISLIELPQSEFKKLMLKSESLNFSYRLFQ